MRVLSVGELLWDVFDGEELLGGAPLNFAANLVRLGAQAALLSAVGEDDRGKRARAAVARLGVSTDWLEDVHGAETGTALVTQHDGEPSFVIMRPAAYDKVQVSPATRSQIAAFAPDWLYCGTLFLTQPESEACVRQLIGALPRTRLFYDMNLREGHWNFALVERMSRLASMVKLNEAEARQLAAHAGLPTSATLEEFAAMWSARCGIDCLCVTLGPAGCMLYKGGRSERSAGLTTRVADTVGAGDAFAAALLFALHAGWTSARAARLANALGSIVAGMPGATPPWQVSSLEQLSGEHLAV